jgi:hypothetical protein
LGVVSNALCIHKNKVFTLGGESTDATKQRTAYKTQDFINWTSITFPSSASGQDNYIIGARLLDFKDRLWLLGGSSTASENVPRINVSDDEGDTWTYVGDMPTAKKDFYATVYNGKMFVISGLEESESSPGAGVYYSEDGINWTQTNDFAVSSYTYNSSNIVVFDGRIMIFGGLDDSYAGITSYHSLPIMHVGAVSGTNTAIRLDHNEDNDEINFSVLGETKLNLGPVTNSFGGSSTTDIHLSAGTVYVDTNNVNVLNLTDWRQRIGKTTNCYIQMDDYEMIFAAYDGSGQMRIEENNILIGLNQTFRIQSGNNSLLMSENGGDSSITLNTNGTTINNHLTVRDAAFNTIFQTDTTGMTVLGTSGFALTVAAAGLAFYNSDNDNTESVIFVGSEAANLDDLVLSSTNNIHLSAGGEYGVSLSTSKENADGAAGIRISELVTGDALDIYVYEGSAHYRPTSNVSTQIYSNNEQAIYIPANSYVQLNYDGVAAVRSDADGLYVQEAVGTENKVFETFTDLNGTKTNGLILYRNRNKGFPQEDARIFVGSEAANLDDLVLSSTNNIHLSAGQDQTIDLLTNGVQGIEVSGGTFFAPNIKKGPSQVGAGAVAGEVWATENHATIEDNVLMIGV